MLSNSHQRKPECFFCGQVLECWDALIDLQYGKIVCRTDAADLKIKNVRHLV